MRHADTRRSNRPRRQRRSLGVVIVAAIAITGLACWWWVHGTPPALRQSAVFTQPSIDVAAAPPATPSETFVSTAIRAETIVLPDEAPSAAFAWRLRLRFVDRVTSAPIAGVTLAKCSAAAMAMERRSILFHDASGASRYCSVHPRIDDREFRAMGVESDQEGIIELSMAGDAILRARHPRYADESFSAASSGMTYQGRTINLGPSTTIRGRVRTESGGVPSTPPLALGAADFVTRNCCFADVADNGEFQLNIGSAEGLIWSAVDEWEVISPAGPVTLSPDQRLDIVVRRAPSIQVIDGETGEPIREFRLQVSDLESGAVFITGSRSSPSGIVALPSPIIGRKSTWRSLRIAVLAKGYLATEIETAARGQADEAPITVALFIGAAGTLHGRVNRSGAPAADANVVCRLWDPFLGSWESLSGAEGVNVASDGAFDYAVLPGRYLLRVTSSEGCDLVVFPVDVPLPAPLEIDLDATAALKVVPATRSIVHADGLVIGLEATASGCRRFMEFDGDVADFGKVEPGEHIVFLPNRGSRNWRTESIPSESAFTITLEPGQDLRYVMPEPGPQSASEARVAFVVVPPPRDGLVRIQSAAGGWAKVIETETFFDVPADQLGGDWKVSAIGLPGTVHLTAPREAGDHEIRIDGVMKSLRLVDATQGTPLSSKIVSAAWEGTKERISLELETDSGGNLDVLGQRGRDLSLELSEEYEGVAVVVDGTFNDGAVVRVPKSFGGRFSGYGTRKLTGTISFPDDRRTRGTMYLHASAVIESDMAQLRLTPLQGCIVDPSTGRFRLEVPFASRYIITLRVLESRAQVGEVYHREFTCDSSALTASLDWEVVR